MLQADIPSEAGSIELQIIDGVEILHIIGKDFIKVSCNPELPSSIVAWEIDGKQGLLTNGVSKDGGLLIKGKAVVLTAPVIYLDADVYVPGLVTEAQDLVGAINEIWERVKNRRRRS